MAYKELGDEEMVSLYKVFFNRVVRLKPLTLISELSFGIYPDRTQFEVIIYDVHNDNAIFTFYNFHPLAMLQKKMETAIKVIERDNFKIVKEASINAIIRHK